MTEHIFWCSYNCAVLNPIIILHIDTAACCWKPRMCMWVFYLIPNTLRPGFLSSSTTVSNISLSHFTESGCNIALFLFYSLLMVIIFASVLAAPCDSYLPPSSQYIAARTGFVIHLEHCAQSYHGSLRDLESGIRSTHGNKSLYFSVIILGLLLSHFHSSCTHC